MIKHHVSVFFDLQCTRVSQRTIEDNEPITVFSRTLHTVYRCPYGIFIPLQHCIQI